MNLTKLERLILVNQFEILSILDPEEEDTYNKKKKALIEGYALHYDDLIDWFSDDMSPENCLEVINILDMYRALTFSFRDLENKNGISEESIHFHGFDGNEETAEYSYTQYFIEDLGRFEELKYGQESPDFNSHSQMLNRYRKMLAIWNMVPDKFHLSADDILRIIKV